MANPRITIFNKKVIRTNTENSVQVGLIVSSLITHLVLFIQIQSNLTFTNFTYIKMCIALN